MAVCMGSCCIMAHCKMLEQHQGSLHRLGKGKVIHCYEGKSLCVCMQAYYLNRSQPPVLAQIIEIAQQHSSSMQLGPDFETASLHALIQEHAFWSSASRKVQLEDACGKKHTLHRYSANWCNPRPESFKCASQQLKRMPQNRHREFYTLETLLRLHSSHGFP
jgi:hypothetical protein